MWLTYHVVIFVATAESCLDTARGPRKKEKKKKIEREREKDETRFHESTTYIRTLHRVLASHTKEETS